VLTVDKREQIRRSYYVDGWSVRRIARECHWDRRTIRKALRDAGPPRYTLRESRARPVLAPYVAQIDAWMEADLTSPPKQRHTARRIFERLVEEHGFKGGESTIRRYVREHRPAARQAFIPLAYEPGEDAQCDFGEGWIVLGGRQVLAQILCLRLCYSKMPFVMAFPHQKQEAFLEGMQRAFQFFGGVPARVWYDRLTQAVKQSLVGQRPQEREAFVAFRSHYLFEGVFCNAGEAHEKGLIENLVGYMRRHFLVPLPAVDSFEELNAQLAVRCLAEAERRLRGEQGTIGEMWEEERALLRPVPSRSFPCCRTLPVKPNRLSLVIFETNRYSVPVEHTLHTLYLRAYVDKVEISDGIELIAMHKRSYAREQDVLDLWHYLPLLKERPGALDHAKPFKQWPRPEAFDRYLEVLRRRLPPRTATLRFLEVLELARSRSLTEMAAALDRALATGSLALDTVEYFLRDAATDQRPAVPVLVSAPSCPEVQPRDLSQYSLLVRR
jgi:transposase